MAGSDQHVHMSHMSTCPHVHEYIRIDGSTQEYKGIDGACGHVYHLVHVVDMLHVDMLDMWTWWFEPDLVGKRKKSATAPPSILSVTHAQNSGNSYSIDFQRDARTN